MKKIPKKTLYQYKVFDPFEHKPYIVWAEKPYLALHKTTRTRLTQEYFFYDVSFNHSFYKWQYASKGDPPKGAERECIEIRIKKLRGEKDLTSKSTLM